MDGTLGAIDIHWLATVVLRWIGHALLLGTALAILTWFFARAARRCHRPAIEAFLWSVVLVKFLVPIGPVWSVSLPDVGAIAPLRSQPANVAPSTELAPSSGMGLAAAIGSATATVTGDVSAPPDPSAPARNAAGVPFRWHTIVVAVYLAAVTGLLGWRIRNYLAFRATCRTFELADKATRSLVAKVCRRLGVRRIPTIRISDDAPAPFVVGLSRPLMVLSRRHCSSSNELETVIVHEVAHLRRGDLAVRAVQWVAGTLLFFWPVVSWVNRRVDVAREHACDQWALRHGRLSPGDYARCLLSSVQPCRVAHRPLGMAANITTIERRIDMILDSRNRRPRRDRLGLTTAVLFLAWSGAALGGAIATTRTEESTLKIRPATEEAVQQRAAGLYSRVAAHETADFSGNGELTYLEKDVYLVALAMQNSGAFMEEFPYADRNHSGWLDVLEAYDVIRGVTLIAYADRRDSAATEPALPLEFCHSALDAQEWLLDNRTGDPQIADMDNIWSVLRRFQGPSNGYGARMFNHGGPERQQGKRSGRPPTGSSRFGELEGNISTIRGRLEAEGDPQMIARLRVMLDKLESTLDRLQGS